MFGSSYPPVVCRRVHVLFTLFVFVYVKWCPTHIVLCFCFHFLRLVYPMLPVSLDCPFLIAPSVFSNVYLARWIIWAKTFLYFFYILFGFPILWQWVCLMKVIPETRVVFLVLNFLLLHCIKVFTNLKQYVQVIVLLKRFS